MLDHLFHNAHGEWDFLLALWANGRDYLFWLTEVCGAVFRSIRVRL